MKQKEKVKIGIDTETLYLLRSQLKYKEIGGKHYLETYDDLIKRLIENHKKLKRKK
jgi:hypothetical protein